MNKLGHRQPSDPRWQLYWQWVESSHKGALKKLSELEEEYRRIKLELNDAKQMVDSHTIKKQKIVGLTTNGAARLQSLLWSLKAPIGKFNLC